MFSTRYSLQLHIKRPPQGGPRVHEIHWAARDSESDSEASRGRLSASAAAATVTAAGPLPELPWPVTPGGGHWQWAGGLSQF